MLICEGYQMFKGTATITPVQGSGLEPFKKSGTWLYKPEQKSWYCQPESGFTRSFPADMISDIQEES